MAKPRTPKYMADRGWEACWAGTKRERAQTIARQQRRKGYKTTIRMVRGRKYYQVYRKK